MDNLPNERLVLTPHAVKRHSRRLQQEIQELYEAFKLNSEERLFSLSEAQNMFSRVLGMKDYHEMSKVLFNTNQTYSTVKQEDNTISIINEIKIDKHLHVETGFNYILKQLCNIEDLEYIVIQTDSSLYINNGYKMAIVDKEKIFNNREIEAIITYLYESDRALAILNSGNDIDLSHQFNIDRNEKIRFRANITSILTEGKKGYVITLKKLRNSILDIAKIAINNSLIQALNVDRGIVFSGGTANSNKELLMHSFLQHKLNAEDKVMCVYEGISEYIYSLENELSSVSYVEVYRSLTSMQDAIRNAQRRHLDIAFFDEIRNPEEIKELINASNSGQIVYTTLVSSSLEDTIRRLYQSLNKNENDFTNLITEISCITQQYKIYQQNKKPVYIQSYLTLTDNIRDQLNDLVSIKDVDTVTWRAYIKSIIRDHGFTVEDALNQALKKNLIDIKTYQKNQHLIK